VTVRVSLDTISFDIRRNAKVIEDIRKAYSADTISNYKGPSTVRKPVTLFDALWTNTGGVYHLQYAAATLWMMCPRSQYTGPVFTIVEKHRQWDANESQRGDMTGLEVWYRGQFYVLTQRLRVEWGRRQKQQEELRQRHIEPFASEPRRAYYVNLNREPEKYRHWWRCYRKELQRQRHVFGTEDLEVNAEQAAGYTWGHYRCW